MGNIQVFLDFANCYQRFIEGFNKIAGPLISMFKISSPTGSSTILKSIDAADENKFIDNESGGNEKNLLNPSTSKKSIRAGYLTSGGVKKSDGNTKKGVKAAKGFDYLILAPKKAFNHLWYRFRQPFILQHFHLEQHIWI